MFHVKSVVLTAALFGAVDGQGCYPTWSAGTSYNAGAIASFSVTTNTGTTTYNYQCKEAPMNQFCGQAGYQPGAVSGYWTQAWTQLTACTGTATPAPTPVPTPPPTATVAGPVSVQGCYPTWSAGTSYNAGAIASYSVTTSTGTTTYNYQCKQAPMSQFCGQAGYQPGAVSGYWTQAWTQLTACTGTATPAPTPVPTSPPTFAAWSGGGCPLAYVSGASYDAGELAEKSGIVYQCKAFPYNAFCGSIGYEPGTGSAWETAWTLRGSCTGSIAPTASPVYKSVSVYGGCPQDYSSSTKYEAGDKVSWNGLALQCKDWPYSPWCNNIAYAPGTTNFAQAWKILGTCDGSMAPTKSPSYVSLSNKGGCPEAYSASIKYEAGDKVSDGSFVYQCKAYPYSGYCNQFAPGSANSNLGWTLLGYCSGSLAPTNSPIYVSLDDHGGCPEAYSDALTYEAGDKATVGSIVYQCKAWPYSGYCNSRGVYAPGNSASNLGWTVLGYCSGSMAPTKSPVYLKLANQGGCPQEYSASITYEAGDEVSVGPLVYQCKSWPNSGYCNSGGVYAPGNTASNLGWTTLGYCSGSIAPTQSPAFLKLKDQGGCPQAFSTTAAYEAGDEVSVNSIVYQCKPWPNSGYCNQHDPGSTYSELGWTVLGYCDGSIAPTKSPVAYTGTNCPPVYVSGTSYKAGDLVRKGAKKYQCKPYPFYLWCSNPSYEPGLAGGPWADAWATAGTC